jgi:hypothetical protein
MLPWRSVLLGKLTVTELVKKFSAFCGNPKVHCRVQKITALDPILRQMNPANTLTSKFFKIHFNNILPTTFTPLNFCVILEASH